MPEALLRLSHRLLRLRVPLRQLVSVLSYWKRFAVWELVVLLTVVSGLWPVVGMFCKSLLLHHMWVCWDGLEWCRAVAHLLGVEL